MKVRKGERVATAIPCDEEGERKTEEKQNSKTTWLKIKGQSLYYNTQKKTKSYGTVIQLHVSTLMENKREEHFLNECNKNTSKTIQMLLQFF